MHELAFSDGGARCGCVQLDQTLFTLTELYGHISFHNLCNGVKKIEQTNVNGHKNIFPHGLLSSCLRSVHPAGFLLQCNVKKNNSCIYIFFFLLQTLIFCHHLLFLPLHLFLCCLLSGELNISHLINGDDSFRSAH